MASYQDCLDAMDSGCKSGNRNRYQYCLSNGKVINGRSVVYNSYRINVYSFRAF